MIQEAVMSSGRRLYTVEEDICLASSLRHYNITLQRRGMKSFTTWFPRVYLRFSTKSAKNRIRGFRRTKKSVEARLYSVQELFRNRISYKLLANNHPLSMRRYDLWKSVFSGREAAAVESWEVGLNDIVEAERAQVERAKVENVPAEREHFTQCEERGSEGPYSWITSHLANEATEQQRQIDSKRLLDMLNSDHRQRAELEMEKEKTARRQQQFGQKARKWEMERLARILDNPRSRDDTTCSHFLSTLVEFTASEARRSLQWEKDAQERLKHDMEMWEKKLSVFDMLMKRYFD